MGLFNRRPRWLIIMVIILMLPLLAYPTMLGLMPDNGANVTLLKLYPLYVLLSGWCMLMCYPARRDVMWILVILVILTHASMWYLTL